MTINQEIMGMADAIRQAVPVERIYLFGSHAYGSPGENSDYDFYLVIPDGDLRPLEAAQKARRSLLAIARKKSVDILADFLSRFEDRKQYNTLEKKIWREGVLLFERG